MPVQRKGPTDNAKKKSKGGKRTKRKESLKLEDVSISTSLPPQVDGQLRCHLRVSISQILWNVANAPDYTQVRLVWWGEHGQGALFRPVDVKQGEKKRPMHRTTARYPVRSGPKQLASYLSDMSRLSLDIVSGPNMVVVGRAHIERLSSLTPNSPINGFFPVFSADDEKVAELHVSVVLESLMASYDSMSSIPTPDTSLQLRDSFSDAPPVNPPHVVPAPHPAPQPVYSAHEDPFRSPSATKFQSRVDNMTPQGVDSALYSRLVHQQQGVATLAGVHDSGMSYPSTGPSFPRSSEESRPTDGGGFGVNLGQGKQGPAEAVAGLAGAVQSHGLTPHSAGLHQTAAPAAYATLADITNRAGVAKDLFGTGSSTGGRDVVSELLARGQKLRDAMIVSTLNENIPDPKPAMGGYYDLGQMDQMPAPTGRALKQMTMEMSHVEAPPNLNLKPNAAADGRVAIGRGFGSVGVGLGGGLEGLSTSETSDMEDKAIDLVLGSDTDLQHRKLMNDLAESPVASLSGDDIQSDLGDPIHDDTILQELFYKNPDTEDSDLSLSDWECDKKTLKERGRASSVPESLHEAGNIRPPSRSSRRSSSSSIILDLEPTRDVESEPPKTLNKKKKTKKKSKAQSFTTTTTTPPTDVSESDQMNTSRMSDASRVSFDPVLSDAEDTHHEISHGSRVDGLSVERLTLLGRVHIARVVIDSLSLIQSLNTTPTKSSTKSRSGKPPRPVKKSNTYFVEYNFPVVATTRDKYSPNAMATEVMRVASKKVGDGLVSFGHRSVFPVLFDGDAVDKWWKSALVFKVYSRSPSQKVPTMLGMCSVALKTVLKAEALYLEKSLEVKDRSGSGGLNTSTSSKKSHRRSTHPTVGMLKFSVELASDSKDFAKALARTRLAEMKSSNVVALPQAPLARAPVNAGPTSSTGHANRERHPSDGVRTTAGTQTEPRPINLDTVPLAPPPPAPKVPSTIPTHHANLDACTTVMEPVEALTLHTLLLVPEGENITQQGLMTVRHGDSDPSHPPQPLSGWTGRDMATRNLYLVCRMFWCEDAARSGICWGTVDPVFKFSQVAPVLLTTSLLERLRNNFVVLEVWDKRTAAENDQLVGMVKLPLHQFYMSYRDRRIAASLLKSQYPVVSIDTSMPVVSPFTGATHGRLKVLLAMGSAPQIQALQNLKRDNGTSVMVPERPLHYLERQHLGKDAPQTQEYSTENIVEHIFEVSIESVRGLRLLDSMIWGEADCFIQYHFPTQTQTRQQAGPALIHAGLSLKTFRTATTLCIPDPVFNDVLRHRINMPEGVPVQREILTACAGAGGGSGGVPLEVWCRYYYPNTRDQLIAKAVLPLAKLCAMVTMKRQGEPNVQTFSLPLGHVEAQAAKDAAAADAPDRSPGRIESYGLLDVTINYNTHITQAEDIPAPGEQISRSLPGAQVCIAVSVLRASALKAAAVAAARHDSTMQYVAEVGANAYTKVQLSFLQKQDERVTRTIARSLAPEFSYHMDFPVPLLWTEVDCDALSLAEILESAEVTFEVWHEVSSKYDPELRTEVPSGEVQSRCLVHSQGDVLLGSATVPLIGLLKRSTGIHGWIPLNMSSIGWEGSKDNKDQQPGSRGLERVVGGLEVALKFAHHEDRQRVLQAGRTVGWVPQFDVDDRDWQDADDVQGKYYEVVVSVDFVCCPLASALLAGQTSIDPSAHMYVRYKFYDRNAVCSKMAAASENEDSYVTCDIHHQKTLVLPSTAPFYWYLNEERLEVQVWLTYQPREAGSSHRPLSRDKLIGSAYLELDTLADRRLSKRQHVVSGVFPLFKPGAANLGGACLRAHVSLRPHTSGRSLQSDEEEEEEENINDCYNTSSKSPKIKGSSKAITPPTPKVDVEKTFVAHVSIERALHLPHVSHKSSGLHRPPCCYVSYQSAEYAEPTCTEVVLDDANPVWSYEREIRLHRDLLNTDGKNLVFKVWHKPEDARPEPDKASDRVLGFVSVDLSPLSSGFRQITGWYNIMDFNGVCQGQVNISVTPQESVVNASKATLSTQKQLTVVNGGFHVPCLPAHINTNTEHLDVESQGVLARFSQHYENVKHFHESLASRLGRHGGSMESAAPAAAESRSTLFSSLRSNMDDLDTITKRLKERLHSNVVPPSEKLKVPPEVLNHTNQSGQTETETSALTNSQQFLPLPAEVNTATSTDGELRMTNESVKQPTAVSTYEATACTSTLVTSNIETLLADTKGSGPSRNGYRSEGDRQSLGFAPKAGTDNLPYERYRSPLQQADASEEEWERLVYEEDVGAGGGVGFEPDSEDGTASDMEGDIVVPRALNDISNVNFNNMMSHTSLQDYTSRLSGEDSWFTSVSPQRISVGPADQQDDSIMATGVVDSNPDATEIGHANEDLKQTGTTLGDTVTSLGGTATSLGTVEEGDPYGRTLLGGRFNRATKLDLNFEDSWASKTGNSALIDHRVSDTEEGVLDQKIDTTTPRGQEVDDDVDDDLQEQPEETLLSVEEKSLIMEEDPLSFSSASRTTYSERSSKKGMARKAALFRREFEHHRKERSSSEESFNSDEEATLRRSRPSRPRSRCSSTKSTKSDRKVMLLEDDKSPDTVTPRSLPDGGGSENEQSLSQSTQERTPHVSFMEPASGSHTAVSCSEPDGGLSYSSQESNLDRSSLPPQDATSHQEGVEEIVLEQNTSQTSKQSSSKSAKFVPNFFLPPSDLEQGLRAIKTNTLSGASSTGSQAASTAGGRFLGAASAKTKPLPNAQHTQRIAKIFSAKYAS